MSNSHLVILGTVLLLFMSFGVVTAYEGSVILKDATRKPIDQIDQIDIYIGSLTGLYQIMSIDEIKKYYSYRVTVRVDAFDGIDGFRELLREIDRLELEPSTSETSLSIIRIYGELISRDEVILSFVLNFEDKMYVNDLPVKDHPLFYEFVSFFVPQFDVADFECILRGNCCDDL